MGLTASIKNGQIQASLDATWRAAGLTIALSDPKLTDFNDMKLSMFNGRGNDHRGEEVEPPTTYVSLYVFVHCTSRRHVLCPTGAEIILVSQPPIAKPDTVAPHALTQLDLRLRFVLRPPPPVFDHRVTCSTYNNVSRYFCSHFAPLATFPLT